MFRLLYVSAVSPSAGAHLPSVVEDILISSVGNNRRDDITGFLLCDGFNFVQALEGRQDKVEACFARICADSRNLTPTLRDIEFAGERVFARWSMCGLTLSRRDDALLGAPDIDFDLTAVQPGALWQYLSSLAQRHGGELDLEHERLLRLAG